MRAEGFITPPALGRFGARWSREERTHPAAGRRLRDPQRRALRQALRALVARTAELEKENERVARQLERLAELDRLKSELIADVSHEFRNPLTLIVGPLRDLQAGACGELAPEARQQVDLASRSAARLLGLVEQILDTATLDAGRLELRVRPGDLGALLTELAERFQALAERRRVRLRFEPPGDPIPIWADPDQLEKIFSNLLTNAMRYTPDGGRVEMTIEHPGTSLGMGGGVPPCPKGGSRGDPSFGWVAVTVRDQGPGIAPEDQERIFDRFCRAVRAAPAGHVGPALGLPLARQLAELHGGRLTLESAPGEGSAFRVELPLGREHFTPSQLVEEPPWPASPRSPALPAVEPAVPDLPPAASGPDPGSSGAPDRDDSADRTTVLLVEDNPAVRSFLRRSLALRYRVAEAANGAAALALARELLPDLVLSDVMMPEMDGFALCRALKQDPELDWVPVVLVTAKAGAEDKLEGLGEGADDYLTKPFDVPELLARVDNLIASRRRLRERFGKLAGGPRPRLPLAPGVRPTADDREWLERVREAIEAGFDDDAFSVEGLAERLAVHRSRLHERLRELTGSSPVQLIGHWRLERAAALLESEAGSVSEVAYAVGFQSVAHFSRRFRERFGQSPSAYRRGGSA